jgi:hypothetical protein
MAANPNILEPREPLVNSQGLITRSWWRFLNGLGNGLGNLSTTVTNNAAAAAAAAAGNQFTGSGGITVTGDPTIFLTPIPPRTMFGNSALTEESPSEVVIDPNTLFFNGNTLTVIGAGSGESSGVGSAMAMAETIAYWGM